MCRWLQHREKPLAHSTSDVKIKFDFNKDDTCHNNLTLILIHGDDPDLYTMFASEVMDICPTEEKETISKLKY
jgi:hypothetical protein